MIGDTLPDLLPFASLGYWCLLSLLLFARGMDFLSTWVATPNLVLEGNPLARKLGWKWGALANLALCFAFAFWPLTAIIVITSGVLVAAHNFHAAWLMRTMGEAAYRDWFLERVARTPLSLYLVCLCGETFLTALPGAALIWFGESASIPFAIGIGVVAYAGIVLFYTSLSLWRLRRGEDKKEPVYYPGQPEFLKLAAQGNLIPVSRRILADLETPLSAYLKIRGQGESFLCESVEGGEHIGRYSFVGCNPRAVIKQTGSRVDLIVGGKVVESFVVGQTVRDGLAVVEQIMGRYQPVAVAGLPRFSGGALGFIGYEFIHDIEPVVPRPPKDDLRTPVMYFLIADELLVFDRVAQTMTILVNAVLAGRTPEEAYEEAVGEIERLVSLLEQPSENAPVDVPRETPDIPFASNMTKETFMENVERAKKYITAGDLIQIVGSQRFSTPVKASPVDLYRAARSINPSPYMFLLELDGFSLVGASPELHVRCEDRHVEIRPIAGTYRRGRTPEEDLALEKALLADPKERAEHVMLVDLARNDIGRVCDFGSVKVKDLMVIERYSHVMHIVSQVEGRLAEGRTPYDLLRATFPNGTLSGAPKIRAMQIIAELEQTARGPYGGCMGYFSFNGNLDCCITIRTALLKDGRAYVQAGGGWVNDSTPEAEFQETVNKAKAMLKAVAMAEGFLRTD